MNTKGNKEFLKQQFDQLMKKRFKAKGMTSRRKRTGSEEFESVVEQRKIETFGSIEKINGHLHFVNYIQFHYILEYY